MVEKKEEKSDGNESQEGDPQSKKKGKERSWEGLEKDKAPEKEKTTPKKWQEKKKKKGNLIQEKEEEGNWEEAPKNPPPLQALPPFPPKSHQRGH